MYEETETTLKAFSDGFGCMAVIDVGDTEECIVNLLAEESPWEVIDGVEKLPRGYYLVNIRYWYEDNFPDLVCSLVTEVIGHERIGPPTEREGNK